MAESRKVGESLELVRIARPGGMLVHLSGVIDGTFDRATFVDWLHGTLVLDMYGVRRITLYGVREWRAALTEIESPAYYFIRVRPAILAQFNVVPDFAGRGQLVSFYAPYQCTACKRKIRGLVDVTQHHALLRALQAPPAACIHCNAKAELDDDPEAFFAYAASAPEPIVPPVVRSIIASAWGGSEHRFSIKKVVRGKAIVLWVSGPLDNTAHFGRLAETLTGPTVINLRGVWTVADKGLERFLTFLQSATVPIYLAGLPLCLVTAFAQHPSRLQSARVVSARLPGRCGTCHDEVELDLQAEMLLTMAQDALVRPPCPECGALLTGFAPETLRAVMALPLSRAPDAIRPHLEDRSRPLVRPIKIEHEDDNETSGITPTLQTGERGRGPRPSGPAKPSGRYDLGRRVGIGSLATWYLGKDNAEPEGKPLLLKVIHPHIARDPSFVNAVEQETRIAAMIRHPNVLRTLEFTNDPATGPIVVMEYVEGARLSEILAMLRDDHRLMQMDVAVQIVLDALAGLEGIHDATDADRMPLEVVHGGLSPSSILVGTDGLTRISDLETARVKSVLGTAAAGLTRRLGFMAPEHLRGGRVDRRSDVYSVAVILWELLAGPRHGEERRPRIIPRPLGDVCLRGLQPDPSERFPTASAFAEALNEGARRGDVTPASAYQVAAVVSRFKGIGI